MVKRHNFRLIPAIFLIFALITPGCARKTDDTTVVATVNGKPIYLKELKRELSNRARQNPALDISDRTLDEIMDNLIKRQIIIQEAMENKMAEDPEFADTIQVYWEQTLIRNFVDYKNKELERYIFVTDKEIGDYYENLKGRNSNIPPLEEVYDKLKEIISRKKKSEAIEDWLEEKKQKSSIKVHKKAVSEATK